MNITISKPKFENLKVTLNPDSLFVKAVNFYHEGGNFTLTKAEGTLLEILEEGIVKNISNFI